MNRFTLFSLESKIIINHLVSSSPHALPQLILFSCVVFPFSGSDDSLPELPVSSKKYSHTRNEPNHRSI